jgi:hypothetical protein
MLSHLNVKPIRTKLKTHRRKTKREERKRDDGVLIEIS